MQEGETVIFNSEYVDEISRHLDSAKKHYEMEMLSTHKEQLKEEYLKLEEKLNWALDFQDKIVSIKNKEIPRIKSCVLLSGLEIPAKHLQCV